jgi:hypothetical protein
MILIVLAGLFLAAVVAVLGVLAHSRSVQRGIENHTNAELTRMRLRRLTTNMGEKRGDSTWRSK